MKGKKLDAVIIIHKTTDNRLSIETIMMIKYLKNFYEGIKPEQTILGISMCDLAVPKPGDI